MDFEDDLDLEEFLFVDRQCRKCLRTLTWLSISIRQDLIEVRICQPILISVSNAQ